jgi:hypothetical protein
MRGLKVRLIMLTMGMIAIFASVTSFLYLRSVEGQKQAKLGAFEAAAAQVADSITAQFYERYGDVQAFGRNAVFYGKDTEHMVTTLNNYASDYGIYDLIIFVDMKGQYVASNSLSAGGKPLNLDGVRGKSYANEAWFKNVVEGRTTDSSDLKGTYFEGPFVDPNVKSAYASDGYGTVFSALVKDASGKPVGVMSNHANWSWVEYDMLRHYAKLETGGFANTDIMLINKEGLVISSIDPESRKKAGEITRDFGNTLLKYNAISAGDESARRAVSGSFGAMIGFDPHEQREHLFGYSGLSGKKWPSSIGWGVTVKGEMAVVFAEITNAKITFFAFGGGIFAACCLFGWWFARNLANKLTEIAKGVTDAGQTVSSTSGELAGASQLVSSGATEAASSLEETVASLEELTSMVRLNSDNAAQAAALAQGSSKTAADGEGEVRALISSITEISQSSQKIEDIINVIDDIAFQTNLLALNAAVEAARAGEQGKGFAVVAEAVRNLAQRSATAAKEISGLIRENVAKIETGTKQADKSGAVLKEILTSVRKVADISNEIASASQEQSAGLGQISKAMNELDQATQRNAATSEQVAASSDEMSHQAAALNSVVNDLNVIIFGGDSHVDHSSELKRPPTSGRNLNNNKILAITKPTKASPIKKAATAAKKGTAQHVIPFGDDENEGKVGTVQGF